MDHFEKVSIGKNFVMGQGTVLDALPLNLDPKIGKRVRLPVNAGVVIGDDVDIGCHCVINLGAEKDTIIEDNVFIGHHSTIGHDSEIGAHTVISANVGVCGCVTIGKWCYIAPGTIIIPNVMIGDYVMIGAGSIVTKDIPSGVIAYGIPCGVVRENLWRPEDE